MLSAVAISTFPATQLLRQNPLIFSVELLKLTFFMADLLSLSLFVCFSSHISPFFIHFYLYRLVLISFVASENCRSAVVFSIVINGTADWKKRLQSLSKHLQVFFELQLETNALSLSDGIWVLGNSSFQIRFIYVSL